MIPNQPCVSLQSVAGATVMCVERVEGKGETTPATERERGDTSEPTAATSTFSVDVCISVCDINTVQIHCC